MSEHIITQDKTKSVWWINDHERLGRIENIKKWLFETANRGTYRPKVEIPFTTSISSEDIELLADNRPRDALNRQLDNIANNDSFLTIPVATITTHEFKHAWSVPRKPMLLLQPQEAPIPGQ
jgi:hypothetical protein